MSYNFNNKDYGEYFSAVEKRLNKEKNSESESLTNRSHASEPNRKPKKIYGGVFRLRPWVFAAVAALLIIVLAVAFWPKKAKADEGNVLSDSGSAQNTARAVKDEKAENLFALADANTAQIGSDIQSECVIVVNCDTNKIAAERNSTQKCYPASTTKIMTLLTAVENIKNYDDTFTFSYEITDPFFIQNATMAGFSNGESVNMTDMLYGTILPSGADACAGLAIKISGSEEEFVKLMNKKADELGLKNTHFTNATGLFDKDHYTTPEDMAVIVRAAMKNGLCKKVLSAYQYTTEATPQHPEGILLTSTLFGHMYGTEPEGADILGGKTGFVSESGYCIASFGKSESENGADYVCVTFKGNGLWTTIYDQINLYTQYAK